EAPRRGRPKRWHTPPRTGGPRGVRLLEVGHLGTARPRAQGVLPPRVSARHWATRLHLPTLGAVALILAAWAALSWRYGAYVLPSPLAVARGFADIVVSGEIWRHT